MKLPFSFSFFARKDRYEKRMLHPMREWLIGIVVFVVCVFTAVAHSAYTFVLFENVSIHTVTAPEGEVVTYNTTLVETVLTRYQERADQFDALLGNLPAKEVEVEQMSTTTEEISVEIEQEEEDESGTTTEVMLGI